MTQLFKTIKIPEEIKTAETQRPTHQDIYCDNCGSEDCSGECECEHDMEYVDTEDRYLEDDCVYEIRTYGCRNCGYWVTERWFATIGEYDYEETEDSGYD